MKKLSLLLLAVVSCVFCVAQPEIKFENTTYDFGKIKEEGGKVTGKFIFTNVGNEPLELTNVRPGCGCTAANYTKGAIAPGEKGYIEATYNPYNRPGAFNKNIRVTTNEPRFIEDEKATPHMIFIKGEVIKRPPTEFEKAGYTKTSGMLRIKEPDVAHNLKNTESVLDTFYVRNFWGKPVSIKLENPADYVSEVYRNFGAELLPGQEGFFVLKYDASKRNAFGQTKDQVTITTNDSVEQVKRIHYAVNIKEDFSKMTPKQLKNAPASEVSATSIDFGDMQKNTTKTEKITIKNNGKNPLIIRGLDVSNSQYKVSSNMTEIPTGTTAEITVTFKAPNRNSTQNASFDIITNDPANPVRTITLNAKVQ
ncbi:MAG: DUF1573 domain-containing protein [Bacteroidales bacterium]|jgi:hypothetical protein|nr:DUF1573 domain-containing protein [Bacteroidales bacterium]